VAEAADMSEADIRAAQTAAEDGENRRRELAALTPGLGPVLPMEQPPSGPSVGKYGVGGLIAGEGYEVQAEIADAVAKAYGPPRPQYGDDLVGGFGFQAGRGEAPIRRHVTDLGADGLFIEGASAPVADGFTVVSPARPGLLSRLRGLLRRGSRRPRSAAGRCGTGPGASA
jgi:hypothetical protein